MSPRARRATKATAPSNADLRRFLQAFGVRSGVLERAARHPSVLPRPLKAETSARAYQSQPTWRTP